ncbi:hypothetical protein FOZ63_017750, partial [Perkinsus olseni]
CRSLDKVKALGANGLYKATSRRGNPIFFAGFTNAADGDARIAGLDSSIFRTWIFREPLRPTSTNASATADSANTNDLVRLVCKDGQETCLWPDEPFRAATSSVPSEILLHGYVRSTESKSELKASFLVDSAAGRSYLLVRSVESLPFRKQHLPYPAEIELADSSKATINYVVPCYIDILSVHGDVVRCDVPITLCVLQVRKLKCYGSDAVVLLGRQSIDLLDLCLCGTSEAYIDGHCVFSQDLLTPSAISNDVVSQVVEIP